MIVNLLPFLIGHGRFICQFSFHKADIFVMLSMILYDLYVIWYSITEYV